MTLGEFQKTFTIRAHAPKCHMRYSSSFPAGVDDNRANGAAYDFAKASGCVIHHQAHKLAVLFVKEA